MISFIICSIHPIQASALQKNISMTVGVEHEIITIDNRETNYGICKVYNQGAKKAHGQHLCFLHEDVCFHGNEWGKAIIAQLKDEATGVIGFMGSIYKSKSPSGWNVVSKTNHSHFIQRKGYEKNYSSDFEQTFAPCVVLDGACLFMRKDVWEKCPFDEEICQGFHGYDIDICLQTTKAGYTNLVCGTCWIEHFSEGNFSEQWARDTLKLHTDKWSDSLPMFSKEATIEEKTYIKRNSTYLEQKAYYVFLKNIYNTGWAKQNKQEAKRHIPYKLRHLILYIKCLLKIYI